MELIVGKFVLLYLLLPIMAIVLGAVMVLIAKKNQLLSNKKLIFYFLAACLLLALPALLGFIDYWFMPYIYIGLQALYLILGRYNLKILKWLIPDIDQKGYYVEFLFSFIIMFIGAAVFSLVFNLCNELQYGIWASTCLLPFIFPTLFRKMYESYMDIPLEIYRTWQYDKEQSVNPEQFGNDKIQVAELELFRQVSDTEPLTTKVKASGSIPFGVWFKLFIDDYNKKSPSHPVVYSDKDGIHTWIFYTTTTILGRRRYIDPEQSFLKNKLKEKNVIMAKRTQYEEYD